MNMVPGLGVVSYTDGEFVKATAANVPNGEVQPVHDGEDGEHG